MSTWFVQSAPGKYDERGRYPLDPLLEEQFEILFPDEPGVGKPQRAAWEYAKQYFEGFAVPEYPPEMIDNAIGAFVAYGFGEPMFFRQRGRILARFPGAPIDINPDAAAVVMGAGQTIASMQVRQIKGGQYVSRLHNFVPPKYALLNDGNKPKDPA